MIWDWGNVIYLMYAVIGISSFVFGAAVQKWFTLKKLKNGQK
jgi:hypothetical protein